MFLQSARCALRCVHRERIIPKSIERGTMTATQFGIVNAGFVVTLSSILVDSCYGGSIERLLLPFQVAKINAWQHTQAFWH